MLNHKKTFSNTVLKILMILISATFTLEFLHAEIYVWIDENGNKVYGDEPKKSDHAKPVELEPLTVLEFPQGSDDVLEDTPQNITNPYTLLAIISPVADETIRDNSGSVSVSLSIEPALVEGHKIQLYLDGSAFQSPQANMSFTISNVDRGTHTLSASVIDESGKSLMQTQGVSFHLHRFLNTK
jgi:hypothetical protein